MRKTLFESPFAAAFRTTDGGLYSSAAGMPAKPGTIIEYGFSISCSLSPRFFPSSDVVIFLFLPFLIVMVQLVSALKVTLIACSSFVCR
ncbi:hypothetical protein D3C78_991270 [compost metagenome]